MAVSLLTLSYLSYYSTVHDLHYTELCGMHISSIMLAQLLCISSLTNTNVLVSCSHITTTKVYFMHRVTLYLYFYMDVCYRARYYHWLSELTIRHRLYTIYRGQAASMQDP